MPKREDHLLERSLPTVSKTRTGNIRIISGFWKRSVIPVPSIDGLRPTGDRVRETIFNWLNNYFSQWNQITVLDAFAGTGALGWEAASRGANEIVLIEKNKVAYQHLLKTKEKLNAENVQVIQGDSLKVTPSLSKQFDLIFIDPPFALNLHNLAFSSFSPYLKKEGLIYVEMPKKLNAPLLENTSFEIYREGKTTEVLFQLLKRREDV